MAANSAAGVGKPIQGFEAKPAPPATFAMFPSVELPPPDEPPPQPEPTPAILASPPEVLRHGTTHRHQPTVRFKKALTQMPAVLAT